MSYHFIGLGGIGMSALAHILLDQGVKVSGSDISSTPITERLAAKGATCHLGHAKEHVLQDATVVYSTDISQDNPELQGAKALHRSELLAQLMQGSKPLLVAGSHGKTTTSSLLTHVLVGAGLDPSFAIGGVVKSLGVNGGHGKGPYFVAEADESDGSFLRYTPYGAILTNIGNDHLSHWKTLRQLEEGFLQFAKSNQSQEHLFWYGEDQALRTMHLPGYSYGFSADCALWIQAFEQVGWESRFTFSFHGITYTDVTVPLIGKHNVLNTAAVFGMGLQLGLTETQIRTALTTFQGVGKRVDKKGEIDSILVLDDYGHHPTEIATTLAGVKRAIGMRRLVVAFQPHRYSRVRDVQEQFGPALKEADCVVVTDIYAAGEQPIEGVTTESLLESLQRHTTQIHYTPRPQLVEFLVEFLEPNDVLLTLGAGDITKVGPEFLQARGLCAPKQ